MGRKGWPTPEQEDLLASALLPPADARAAFLRWSARGVDGLDLGSRRLLPLVYRNLEHSGVDETQLQPLREAYVRTAAANTALFERLASVLRALAAASLPSLVLKGPALAVLHYRDAGVRPMRDLDVLVRAAHFERARGVVEGLGFVAAERMLHAVTFRDAEGRELDLHRRLVHASLFARPGSDDAFWDAAVPLEIAGAASLALGPADQLLHTFEHGLRYSARVAPLRWVADAAAVLRTSAVDWDRLASLAEERLLTLPAGDGVAYLERLLGARAGVPAGLAPRLKQRRVPRWVALDYRAQLTAPAQRGPLEVLWTYASQHAEEERLAGREPSLGAFLDFLRRIFGLRSAWRLPGLVVSGFLRRGLRAALPARSAPSAGSAAPPTGTPR
jgi:hypothetical protein